MFGVDFDKTRYPFLSMLPCGRPRSQKITISLFVDVALRAASTLKNRIFFDYLIFLTLQHSFICLDLSLGTILDGLVLKNAVECTSQRLKRTSGARVMIFPIFPCLCFLFSPIFRYCSLFVFPAFPNFSIFFPICVLCFSFFLVMFPYLCSLFFHIFPYFSLPVRKK